MAREIRHTRPPALPSYVDGVKKAERVGWRWSEGRLSCACGYEGSAIELGPFDTDTKNRWICPECQS